MSGSEDIVGTEDELGLPAAAPQDAHRVDAVPLTNDQVLIALAVGYAREAFPGAPDAARRLIDRLMWFEEHAHIGGTPEQAAALDEHFAELERNPPDPAVQAANRERLRESAALFRHAAASGETSTPAGSIAPQGDANPNAELDRMIGERDDWSERAQQRAIELADAQAEIARLSEQVEKQGKVVRLAKMARNTDWDGMRLRALREALDALDVSERITREKGTASMDAAGNIIDHAAALNGLVVVGEDGDDQGLHSAAPNDVSQ